MTQIVRIANAGGFWGDRIDAAAGLLRQQPDLDFITIDYLAEVSMSILAKQRERDPQAGYAADFIETMKLLAPTLRDGSRVRVITNAGGLNPRGCAEACSRVLREVGCTRRIAVVSGDDVLNEIRALCATFSAVKDPFWNMETGKGIDTILPRLVTANAYLGAREITEALEAGADIVITGRVADPSLTVAACAAHFSWVQSATTIPDQRIPLDKSLTAQQTVQQLGDALKEQTRLEKEEGRRLPIEAVMVQLGHLKATDVAPLPDYDRIAAATIAGHLIECGTQVTGGISTDWLEVPDPARMGFPIIEMQENGEFVVTKPSGTGGRVDELTVKEQLLYEIGDPTRYLSPDATVSFLSLKAEQIGPDRVRVTGATGGPPPDTYKVSATYRAGYRASGMLTVFGRDAVAKARRCADIVRQRLRERGCEPQGWQAECLGSGDAVPVCGTGVSPVQDRPKLDGRPDSLETVLRISVSDERREVVEQFSRELMPLVTSGPQGVTGYAEGRPKVREVFGYWPCLIGRSAVQPRWEMLEVQT